MRGISATIVYKYQRYVFPTADGLDGTRGQLRFRSNFPTTARKHLITETEAQAVVDAGIVRSNGFKLVPKLSVRLEKEVRCGPRRDRCV